MPLHDTFRTLRAFSIHGRAGTGVLDYHRVVLSMFGLDGPAREFIYEGRIVALTAIENIAATAFSMRFMAEADVDSTRVYDRKTHQEVDLNRGPRVFAGSILVVIDTTSRIVVAEHRRPGVSLDAVMYFFELSSDRLTERSDSRFTLTPKSDSTFVEEIGRYSRVRQVSVELARPNFDWSDSADQLSDLTDKSGGEKARFMIDAPRNGSLRKDEGILRDISSMAEMSNGPLNDVVIKGTKYGDAGETTMRLSTFVSRLKVRIDRSVDETAQVIGAAQGMIDRLAARARTNGRDA